MKTKLITAAAVLIVLIGFGILLYPVVSNMIFQKGQEELITYYENQIKEIPAEEINTMLDDCRKYNQELLTSKVKLTDPFDDKLSELEEHPYIDLLNENGDGSMGFIEIPSINCRLVVYHYTDADVLAKGIGHLHGTSLPVGGKGSHSVLSGHTGTADKEFFTNLDQLNEGDVFYLHILDETLAYMVDSISVVLPNETEGLYIDSERDLVTLVTCTPYGINSHRLLVRGTRVDYEEALTIESETSNVIVNTWMSQYILAVLMGIGISIVVVILILVGYRHVSKARRRDRSA